MKHEVMTIEQFNALPDSGKRTVIAQDALKWMSTGVINACTGSYVKTYELRADKQVRDLMHGNDIKCSVCAKGALFLSHIGIFNELKVSDIAFNDNSDSILVELNYFSRGQLNLIEAAFECGTICMNGTTEEERVEAISFGEQYENDRERLIAILNNIISNGGEFKPEIYE